jgi:hypothetical protein
MKNMPSESAPIDFSQFDFDKPVRRRIIHNQYENRCIVCEKWYPAYRRAAGRKYCDDCMPLVKRYQRIEQRKRNRRRGHNRPSETTEGRAPREYETVEEMVARKLDRAFGRLCKKWQTT